MKAFEISVNGETLCTIGTDEPDSTFTTILLGRKPDSDKIELGLSELNLLAAGSIFRESGVERLEWVSRSLRVGDAVTIRIIETDDVDAPARRTPPDPALREERLRAHYEQLKAEYGN